MDVDVEEEDTPTTAHEEEETPAAQKKPKKKKRRSTKQKGGEEKRRWCCTEQDCGFSATCAKDLSRHMRKHTGEKPFVCQECGKAYSRCDKLTLHVRTHLNLKPFKCPCCPYAAVDSSSVRKHMRIHSDERPYKCQICPYAARESSQLVMHLRSHTGDSPYTCMEKGCEAAFKSPSDLKRHSRLHTGEKPFACLFCEYKAAVKGNLNTHIRKLHKEEVTSTTPTISPVKRKFKKEAVEVPAPETTEEQQYVSNVCEVDFSSVYSVPDALSNESCSGTSADPDKNNPRIIMIVKKESGVDSDETALPFQYACKQCPFKGNTLKSFGSHLKKVHKSAPALEPMTDEESQHPRPVGRPSRNKKVVRSLKGAELETFFDCSVCSASFVREDSLRCHMRHHSEPSCNANQSLALPANPQFLGFLSVAPSTVAPSSSSGDGGLFTSSYPNLNFSNGDSSDGEGSKRFVLQETSPTNVNAAGHLFVVSSARDDNPLEIFPHA